MVNGYHNYHNHDNISKEVLKIISKSSKLLETKEIEEAVNKKIHGITRTKLFYRLMILRGEGVWWKNQRRKEDDEFYKK